MAPKAKAGGRPKAMAAMRRPAVAGGGGAVIAPRRRGLRRPAALGERQTPWELGQEVDLHTVPLDKLAPGLSLAVTKAEYFGGTVKIAGTIVRVEQTRNDVSLWMELSGTDSEAILKAHSGKRGQEFRLHLCSPMCDRQESGDYLLHALKGRRVRLEGEEGWVTSLELGKDDPAEDELAAVRLRERQLALDKREDAKKPKKSRKRSRSEEVSVEAKDKTKKKKKKKGEVRDAPQWATCVQSRPKEFGPALRRYGLGPAGKDTASSPAQGQSFCSQEEEQALQLECLQRELKLLDEQHVSSGGGRGGLHGRNEGQAAVREVSGSAGYGNAPKYAEEPFGDSGGTRRCPVRQACRPVVLSQHTGSQDHGSAEPGVVEHLDCNRLPFARQACLDAGHRG